MGWVEVNVGGCRHSQQVYNAFLLASDIQVVFDRHYYAGFPVALSNEDRSTRGVDASRASVCIVTNDMRSNQ